MSSGAIIRVALLHCTFLHTLNVSESSLLVSVCVSENGMLATVCVSRLCLVNVYVSQHGQCSRMEYLKYVHCIPTLQNSWNTCLGGDFSITLGKTSTNIWWFLVCMCPYVCYTCTYVCIDVYCNRLGL